VHPNLSHGRFELESEAAWRDLVRQGYDAVTLGVNEIQAWDFTKRMLEETPLPLVCSNLERLVDDKWVPLGEPYKIVEKADVKVGIISAIGGPQLAESSVQRKTGGEVRLLPPVENAQRFAEKAREEGAEVVILLAHIEDSSLEEYASLLDGYVDVIVGGRHTVKAPGPTKPDGTNVIINRSGTRGQHIAVTRLIVDPKGKIKDFGGKNVTLGPDMPEDEEIAAEVARVKEEAKARLRENRKARRKKTEGQEEKAHP